MFECVRFLVFGVLFFVCRWCTDGCRAGREVEDEEVEWARVSMDTLEARLGSAGGVHLWKGGMLSGLSGGCDCGGCGGSSNWRWGCGG